MIPLHLHMDGFACYRGDTKIDFMEPDVNLFAIAGPTGSGKSAILDAITFALYGQTARLGARGVLESLVSPGADRMWVRFEFQSGTHVYRVTRQVVVRESGAAQEVRVEERVKGAWRQHASSEKIRSANEFLERVAGLDYDGFTRAVLLPQGAFDQFLRGDPGKRRNLLTTLLGLERVDEMRAEANRRATEARNREKALAERLQEDYGDATPEVLAEQEAEVVEAEAAKGAAAERARQARDRAGRYEAFIDLENRHYLAGKAVDAARAVLSDEARDTLARAEAAAPIMPLLTAFQAAQKEAHDANENIKGLQRDLNAVAARLPDLERAEQEADKVRHDRQVKFDHRVNTGDRIATTHDLLTRHGFDISLRSEADDGPWDLGAWRQVEEDAADLAKIEMAFTEKVRLEAQVGQYERAVREAADAVTAARHDEGEASTAAKDAEDALATILKAERHATFLDHVHGVRDRLTDDSECPVCGGPFTHADAPDLDRPGARPDVADDARRAATEATARHERAKAHLEHAERARSEAQAQVNRAKEALDQARQAIREAGYDPADDLADLRKSIHFVTKAHMARAAAWLHAQIGPFSPDQHLRQVRAAAEDAAREHQQAVTARQEAAQQRDRLHDRIDIAKEAYAAAEKRWLAAHDTYLTALRDSPFESGQEVRAAFLPPDRLRKMRDEQANAESDLRTAEAEKADTEAKMQDERYDDVRHANRRDVTDELHAADAAADDAATRHARAVAQRDATTAKIEKAKTLRQQQRDAGQKADLFNALGQDLRGDRFPAYLLTKAQDQLAARASHVLRDVTDGRYDLVLLDGEYHVRDAWNTGLPRSVKTLSGGETFIASLALALALSDILMGHTELGALFLDEGFGTLDAAALDAVAGVLENLTRDGRMVGVISHVDSLTARMPARLMIEKHASGSTARWEA